MDLKLKRQSHNEFGTFGNLEIDNVILQTVEPQWLNNKPFFSCIPNGIYDLEYYESTRHGGSYILSNLDLGVGKTKGETRRFACLIHIANLASQLQGCIAPGLKLSVYKGQWSVRSSGDAMDTIIKLLGKTKKHTIEISSDFPGFIENLS